MKLQGFWTALRANRTLQAEAGWLVIGGVAARIATGLLTLVLIRLLGPSAFGVFAIAMSASMIAAFGGDLGFQHTAIRGVSQDSGNTARVAWSALSIRLLLSILVSIGSYFFVSWYFGEEAVARAATAMVPMSVLGLSLVNWGTSVLIGLERLRLVAGIRLLNAATLSVPVVIAVVSAGSNPISLAAVYGAANLVSGVVMVVILARMLPWVRPSRGSIAVLQLGSLAFASTGFLFVVSPHLGVLIMERLTSVQDVGEFAIAFRVALLVYVLPNLAAQAYYPRLFRLGLGGGPAHERVAKEQFKVVLVLGLALALPMLLVPAWIGGMVLGGDGVPAVSAVNRSINVLGWLVVVQAVSLPFAHMLVTRGLQWDRARAQLVGVVSGVASLSLLVPHLGAVGAATGVLVLEMATLLLLVGYCIGRFGSRVVVSIVGGPVGVVVAVLACGGMVGHVVFVGMSI